MAEIDAEQPELISKHMFNAMGALWVACLAHIAYGWSCNDVGATSQLVRESLVDVDPLAVCNDGTAAAFYWKRAASDNWRLSGLSLSVLRALPRLIYLAGGGWCYDLESCEGRFNGTLFPHSACATSSISRPCYMSSKDYPEIRLV